MRTLVSLALQRPHHHPLGLPGNLRSKLANLGEGKGWFELRIASGQQMMHGGSQ